MAPNPSATDQNDELAEFKAHRQAAHEDLRKRKHAVAALRAPFAELENEAVRTREIARKYHQADQEKYDRMLEKADDLSTQAKIGLESIRDKLGLADAAVKASESLVADLSTLIDFCHTRPEALKKLRAESENKGWAELGVCYELHRSLKDAFNMPEPWMPQAFIAQNSLVEKIDVVVEGPYAGIGKSVMSVIVAAQYAKDAHLATRREEMEMRGAALEVAGEFREARHLEVKETRERNDKIQPAVLVVVPTQDLAWELAAHQRNLIDYANLDLSVYVTFQMGQKLESDSIDNKFSPVDIIIITAERLYEVMIKDNDFDISRLKLVVWESVEELFDLPLQNEDGQLVEMMIFISEYARIQCRHLITAPQVSDDVALPIMSILLRGRKISAIRW